MSEQGTTIDARDDITDVPGVRAGHWTDLEGLTGCTVVLAEAGAAAGVDVRGAAPGTRETDLLQQGRTVERIHAVLLTGGSAFGLAAADGVMGWLRERGTGLPMREGAGADRAGRGDLRPGARCAGRPGRGGGTQGVRGGAGAA